MFQLQFDPGEVQYMGIPGISYQCLLAVDTIVNSQNLPRKASVVSWMRDRQNWHGEHLFLFWDWNDVPLTVVHSGFTSGYPGEGPRSFSEALCMIYDRDIHTNLIHVNESDFSAIEERRLTSDLIDVLRNSDDRPLGWPWPGVMNAHLTQLEDQTFWNERHESKLVFDFLDPELSKQCRTLYLQDAEAAVFTAFKVVEQRLRTMLHKPSMYGERLIKDALDPEKGILTDQSLPKPEREGLLHLFVGAHKFVRNPRGHRFLDEQDEQLGVELIYFADLLLRLLPAQSAGSDQPVDESSEERPSN